MTTPNSSMPNATLMRHEQIREQVKTLAVAAYVAALTGGDTADAIALFPVTIHGSLEVDILTRFDLLDELAEVHPNQGA